MRPLAPPHREIEKVEIREVLKQNRASYQKSEIFQFIVSFLLFSLSGKEPKIPNRERAFCVDPLREERGLPTGVRDILKDSFL